MMKNLLFSVAAGIIALMPMKTYAQEAYAALSNDNTTLTFYYDNNKSSRNGMDIGPFSYENRSQRGWYESREEITTVVFDDSFADMTSLTSTAYWFNKCEKLNTIIGIENLKTYNVADMSSMFDDCKSLTSLDLRTFYTNNVTNMGCMFSGCNKLINLDVSSFNTSNVIYMHGMFEDLTTMKSLDLSNFNTEKVLYMNYMFEGCYSLSNINLGSFNTSNVTNMCIMFQGCKSLTTLDLGNFNTSNVTDMHNMFRMCTSLTNLNISSFDTSNVTNMNSMFSECESLSTLDLSSFNTSNVTNMSKMFSKVNNDDIGCIALTTIYVSNEWSIEKIEQGERMFDTCPNLVGGNGTKWDENHTDYTYAHIDGGVSNPGYLTYKAAGEQTEHIDKKCATPTIIFVDGELAFSCETEGVEYTYEITSDDTKNGNGNKVKIGGTYKVSVYATKAGYENSDVATLEFTLGTGGEVCDVNRDGTVDVADISTIISKMAGK